MGIKTYVINLKDSVDRKKEVLAELSRFPFMDPELIEAVDGRKMSQEEIDEQFDCRKFKSYFKRDVLRGEIGCTLSHRECYRKFLESSEDVVLIVEDDLLFLADEKTVESLVAGIIERMPDKPYVMTFTRQDIYYPRSEYKVGQYSFCRIKSGLGTCAYLINRKAAEILLKKIRKPHSVADDYMLMGQKGIRVEGIHPILAIGKSEIGEIASSIDRSIAPDVKVSFCYKLKMYLLFKYYFFLCCVNIMQHRNLKDYMKMVDTQAL